MLAIVYEYAATADGGPRETASRLKRWQYANGPN